MRTDVEHRRSFVKRNGLIDCFRCYETAAEVQSFLRKFQNSSCSADSEATAVWI